ncbi:hypothetical protein DFJ74DRAFT_671554 [Hyaloraphidium curvatum]|nr:hypothetical protein DFJ74DRAFT_671554 [Hyaloraphidium curvatum]
MMAEQSAGRRVHAASGIQARSERPRCAGIAVYPHADGSSGPHDPRSDIAGEALASRHEQRRVVGPGGYATLCARESTVASQDSGGDATSVSADAGRGRRAGGNELPRVDIAAFEGPRIVALLVLRVPIAGWGSVAAVQRVPSAADGFDASDVAFRGAGVPKLAGLGMRDGGGKGGNKWSALTGLGSGIPRPPELLGPAIAARAAENSGNPLGYRPGSRQRRPLNDRDNRDSPGEGWSCEHHERRSGERENGGWWSFHRRDDGPRFTADGCLARQDYCTAVGMGMQCDRSALW